MSEQEFYRLLQEEVARDRHSYCCGECKIRTAINRMAENEMLMSIAWAAQAGETAAGGER